MTQVSASPLQGLLGGVSIAFSVSFFLLVNGGTFGVSGFIHRSLRWNGSWEDRLAVLGLLISGICIGVVEKTHRAADGQSAAIMLAQGTLIRAAIAGFLTGVGSRLQNGCTSGHMICGVSKFSNRSLLATSIFMALASIIVHIHRAYLPSVTGYDWSLGSIGSSLLAVEELIALGLVVFLVFYCFQGFQYQAGYGISTTRKVMSLGLAVIFGLGLHLSTLTSASTVSAFLISPVLDSNIFDPTLLFVALSAVPISSSFYLLVSRYGEPRVTAKGSHETGHGSTRPLLEVQSAGTSMNQCGEVPILGDWLAYKSGPVDYWLIAGAVLFGLGWGLEGICPGPSLVNMGRYIYSVAIRGETAGASRLCVWLVAFVIGGKLMS